MVDNQKPGFPDKEEFGVSKDIKRPTEASKLTIPQAGARSTATSRTIRRLAGGVSAAALVAGLTTDPKLRRGLTPTPSNVKVSGSDDAEVDTPESGPINDGGTENEPIEDAGVEQIADGLVDGEAVEDVGADDSVQDVVDESATQDPFCEFHDPDAFGEELIRGFECYISPRHAKKVITNIKGGISINKQTKDKIKMEDGELQVTVIDGTIDTDIEISGEAEIMAVTKGTGFFKILEPGEILEGHPEQLTEKDINTRRFFALAQEKETYVKQKGRPDIIVIPEGENRKISLGKEHAVADENGSSSMCAIATRKPNESIPPVDATEFILGTGAAFLYIRRTSKKDKRKS